MIKMKRSLLMIMLIIPLSISAQGTKAKQIDDFLAPFVKANQFGGQIVAAQDGKIIYEKAFGLANADFNIPNAQNTRIGIASITKSMTMVILTRLIENKKVELADKLSKYIPDFPNGDKITIEMLARHRSGIPHRIMAPEMESLTYSSAEFIEQVKKAKLAFEPGTQNLYSSAGYATLARVLEIASGKSYAQLLAEYVFGPADMRDSLTFTGEAIIERRAQDYYPSPDGVINVPLKDYSFLVGAGSVFSTARDVYKFGQAVESGKYGESAKRSLIGDKIFSSSGSTNGHRAYIEIDNGQKYAFVIVANMSGAFDTIQQGLSEILQDKPVTAKYTATPAIIANPNKDLSEFAGNYKRTTDGLASNMLLRNGYLYAGDTQLYPIKPDCFFEYRFFGQVCFVRNDNGKITEASWKGVGFDMRWAKQ